MSEKMQSTRDAYSEVLVEMGEQFPNLVVIDADTSLSTKSTMFGGKFPDRFFNVGIAEQNLIGVAAGFALAGKLPVATAYGAFIPAKCFDQIRNSIAYPNLNVKTFVSHTGLTTGADGATHQPLEDIAIMRTLPNYTVIEPADGVETKKAIHAALVKKGPVHVRMHRHPVPIIYSEDFDYKIGKANILQEGSDVTLVACGVMVHTALEAGKQLQKNGISARVIDNHTIKPIDQKTLIKAARDTGAIVTAEDHNILGGMGSAVAEVLAENHPTFMRRVGVNDTFGESGSANDLLQKYGLTVENIVQKAEELLKLK
ncbi:MAG: transketolase family protein [Candidatus Ranarchaeia archaeon]|jgi:transketolase